MSVDIDDAARALERAQQAASAVSQFPEGMSDAEAYRVQHALVALRFGRGERLVGTKLGFTSEAKMAQMGVSDIIVGQLTDRMQVRDGADVDLARFVHPRIEPEVAFRLARDVDPDDPGTDIVACLDAVAPALEIIDSRYRDFRFSLPDVIADNTSAAAFVVGPWSEIGEVGDLAVRLTLDGVDVEVGSTAAILGHPMRALEALVPMARRFDFPLTAGQVILAGAATAAAPFTASTVQAHVAGLGTVSVRGLHSVEEKA